jgi:hypothetical protein
LDYNEIYFYNDDNAWAADHNTPPYTGWGYLYPTYITQNPILNTEQKTNAIHLFITGKAPPTPTNPNGGAIQGYASGVPDKTFVSTKSWFFQSTNTTEIFRNLSHEFGHNFGNWHPYDSGPFQCSDVAYSLGTSNNIMDGWPGARNAATECQLARMHYFLEGVYVWQPEIADVVIPYYCTYHATEKITIAYSQNYSWLSNKKLWGDIELENNSQLHIKCNTSFPDGAKITINDGAVLSVEEAMIYSACNNGWEGTIEVKANGTLHLKTGSSIVMRGNGIIKIEPGGKLIFDEGASISLLDDNTLLEINGDLEIGLDAIFTFNGAGFIRFNLPATTTNIIATPTSSIILEGSGKNDKIIEVVAGSWVSPPSTMSFFKIRSGKVEMGLDSYINIETQGYNLSFMLVTNLVSNELHNGLIVNGQNSYFGHVEIENGNAGLTAYNFNYGNDLHLQHCNFHHNTIGLKVYGKGAHLQYTVINYNNIGWQSFNMDKPSTFHSCNISDNVNNGVDYRGSGSGSLYSTNNNLLRNLNGIKFMGQSLMISKCDNIKINQEAGFLTGIFSYLNLSSTGIPNFKGGSSNISNNLYTFNFLPFSAYAFLENGNNSLWTNLQSNSLITTGTLYNGCSSTLYATGNKWYSNSYSAPSSNDYSIYKNWMMCYWSSNTQISIIDNNPAYYGDCIMSTGDPDPDKLYSPLIFCTDCPNVDSEYLEPSLNFKDAVLFSLGKTTLADSIEGDDVLALNIFFDIIRTGTEHWDNEEVQWLTNYSYYFIKQTLGNGISRGTIQESMEETSFIKMNEIINILIELAINYDLPIKQFMYRMDQALLYNLANDRLTALALLEESASCIEDLDTELLDWINQWKSHINAVENIVNGEYEVMDYDELYEEGYQSGGRLHVGLGVAKRDTVINSPTAFSITGNQTANDNSGNQYFISSVVKDSLTDFLIVKYDASTNILWSDTIGGWSRGADTARIVFVDDWDNVYMSGQAWNGSNYDVMTVKYDSTGAKQWIAMHNSIEKWHDVPYGITVDTSGFVYVALQSTSDSGSYHSMITYSQCNCPTGARLGNQTLPENNTPTSFLESNLEVYPNPVNKQLTISFTDRENQISVKMINALGQEIYNNNFNGVLEIDVSTFPKGVYLIHFEEISGGTKTVKKVLLQ